MSITKLQDRPIVIGTPVDIAFAVNVIREKLSALPWISHPYFIAERFIRRKNNRNYSYPETYAPTAPGSRNYHRLTPDGDYKGMFFFFVGPGQNDFQGYETEFMTHNVAVIFSVNLDLIDKDEADQGLFTRRLQKEARQVLKNNFAGTNYKYSISSETSDLREVYQEFTLEDLEKYNRAPMQCFRFNLSVTVEENCE